MNGFHDLAVEFGFRKFLGQTRFKFLAENCWAVLGFRFVNRGDGKVLYVDLTATTTAAFKCANGDDRAKADGEWSCRTKGCASKGCEPLFSRRNGGDSEGAGNNSDGACCEESAL